MPNSISVEEYKTLIAQENTNKKKKYKTQAEKDAVRLAGRKMITDGEINEHVIVGITPVTKKNHQRIVYNKYLNQRWIAPSQQYIQYGKDAKWFLPKDICINLPVNIKCIFYVPTKKLYDLSNLLEAIDDVMVEAGYIFDDNYKIIVSHDGSRVYYDKENPRTEIYITNMYEKGDFNG